MPFDPTAPLKIYNDADLQKMTIERQQNDREQQLQPLRVASGQQQIVQGQQALDLGKLQQAKTKNDLLNQLLGTVTDQPSYDAAVKRASAFGIPTDGVPTQYNPSFVNQLRLSSLSMKDRLDYALENRKLDVSMAQNFPMVNGQFIGGGAAAAGGMNLGDLGTPGAPGALPAGMPGAAPAAMPTSQPLSQLGTTTTSTGAFPELSPATAMPTAGTAGADPTGTPLSVRNNNPGNMRDPKTGNFQQFSNPSDGDFAMKRDLLGKISGESAAMKRNFGEGYSPTLANVISTWAPSSENNTGAYVQSVAQKLGITPDTVLQKTDIDRLASAITGVEGGAGGAQYFQQAAMGPSLSSGGPAASQQLQPLDKGATLTMQAQPTQKTTQTQAYADMTPQKQSAWRLPPITIGGKYQDVPGAPGQVYGWNSQTGQKEPVDVPGFVSEDKRKMMQALPQAVATVRDSLNVIDNMIGSENGKTPQHPGLAGSIGMKDSSYLFGMKKDPIGGTNEANFMTLYKQLQGKNFLAAYNTLRGGGSITEVEGAKAQESLARMDTAQDEKTFIAAMKDFRDVLKAGVDRQQRSSLPQGDPRSLTNTTTSDQTDPMGLR